MFPDCTALQLARRIGQVAGEAAPGRYSEASSRSSSDGMPRTFAKLSLHLFGVTLGVAYGGVSATNS